MNTNDRREYATYAKEISERTEPKMSESVRKYWANEAIEAGYIAEKREILDTMVANGVSVERLAKRLEDKAFGPFWMNVSDEAFGESDLAKDIGIVRDYMTEMTGRRTSNIGRG